MSNNTLKAYLSGEMKNSLAAVSHFVGSKTAIPAAQAILIKGDRHTGLNVTSTDLVVGIRASIPAQVSSEGTVLIPPNLVDLVAGAQKVTLKQDGEYDLGVQTEAYKGKLKGLPAEEYPEEPPIVEELFSVPAAALKEILTTANFAGNNYPYIKLSWRPLGKGKIRLNAIGTDGFVAGVYTVDLPGTVEAGSVVIPNNSTKVFETLLSLSDAQSITLSKGTNKLMASDGKAVCWACLSNIAYPEVEKVFTTLDNTKGEGILRLAEIDFGASKMMALMAGEKSTAGVIKFGSDEVLLMSQETSLGSGQFSIPFAESSVTEDISIAIGFELVRRVANSFSQLTDKKGGNAKVSIFSDRKPLLFKMQTSGGGRIATVLMPMAKSPEKQPAPSEEEAGDNEETQNQS
jgi:DNA polymerase III sliding clamp (beta) subunit (PCNA family)